MGPVLQRLLVQAMCMTGSDLNASSKPWYIQEKTSEIVYEEFHDQVSKTSLLPTLLQCILQILQ